jgi:chromosome segregation ATPase
MDQTTVTLIIGVLTFFGGILTSIIGNTVIRNKNNKDAQNELRDDLMHLYREQQAQIALLNTELLRIRDKNVELLESLNKEKELASRMRIMNDTLQIEIEHLKKDRARLADQVMMLEEQIRQLQRTITELQTYSHGYQQAMHTHEQNNHGT